MKLELKHISPYLPYGLNIWYNATKGIILDKMDTSNIRDVILYNKNYKPILRPLSDLTKEIEHNGERFIPIMRIFGGDTYDHDYKYEISIVEKPILGERIEISVEGLGSPCISFSISNILNNPLYYSQWKELLEWHFDIFGLHEKNLCVYYNEI